MCVKEKMNTTAALLRLGSCGWCRCPALEAWKMPRIVLERATQKTLPEGVDVECDAGLGTTSFISNWYSRRCCRSKAVVTWTALGVKKKKPKQWCFCKEHADKLLRGLKCNRWSTMIWLDVPDADPKTPPKTDAAPAE